MSFAVQLIGSLLAVFALGWFARWLGLGGDPRIEDQAHAIRLAHQGQFGFVGAAAVVDLAGYSALVRDTANRHVLVAVKGSGFVTRMVNQPIAGRLDQKFLTLDLQEPNLAPVTLNLGEAAQHWASGLRHIPHG